MSTLPEHEFDLEKLFLPAWATEPPKPTISSRAREEAGEEERKARGRGRARGRAGAPGGPATRGGGAAAGTRPETRSPRASGTAAGTAGAAAKPGRPPLPGVEVRLIPDPKGVDQVARRIRSTGRAFPLFDIAKLFLERPERYSVELSVKKKPDGTVRQPLYLCALDETPWLSVDEVVAHVLEKYFDTFYQAERTPTEPPKGKYTFVAQCGYSGVILGPPNHHDYPQRLRQLHAERFSHIPFETYKARVKIVRDEAVVKKWLEEQSWKTEYICLNVPEPLRLGSRDAVERHFREVHAPNIVREVELVTLSGTAAQNVPCKPLARLIRHTLEEQRRFPLQIATALSQQFAAHGLQFFKVNRTITHVAVARPHYLDIENTPVSLNVKRIVQYIQEHPRCTRRELIEALAPSPKPAEPAAPPATQSPGPAEGEQADSTPAQAAAQPAAAPHTPTPEQTMLIADLHWLIHQGHVIEFASGALEVAKKPASKPAPQPAGEGKEAQAAPAQKEGAAAPEAAPDHAADAAAAQAGGSLSGESAGPDAGAAAPAGAPADAAPGPDTTATAPDQPAVGQGGNEVTGTAPAPGAPATGATEPAQTPETTTASDTGGTAGEAKPEPGKPTTAQAGLSASTDPAAAEPAAEPPSATEGPEPAEPHRPPDTPPASS